MRGTNRGTEASFLRIVPAALVATLVLSGVAVCGVAATGGAEFSVDSIDTDAVAGATQTVATVSGASGSGSSTSSTTAGAALGLTTSPPAVGLELGQASSDVPIQGSTQAATQPITVPAEPSDVAIELPPAAETTIDTNPETPGTDASEPDPAAADTSAAEPAAAETPIVAEFDESGVSSHQTEIEPAGEPEQEVAELEVDTDRQPFAAVGGITLYGPANQIRAAGFHESANTQALEMRELDSSLETMVMPSRGRGTGGHTAADMAVYPDETIFSPVTGTVVDARAYKLYCKYDDHVVIIEPDAADDRRVKVLHLADLLIENGDRVIAGTTPIASGPTTLPFSSQIDSFVENSTNTHVHIETVDLNRVDATNSTVCP